jgi:pyruvate/2-oxoglutarate dehydrogenase complex dihydrolipoamide dehydrogenase (E3) component
MKVAVIERNAFGGTCVNTGCIPTKTMVASANAARMAARAAEYGVEVGSVRVDRVHHRDGKTTALILRQGGVEQARAKLG